MLLNYKEKPSSLKSVGVFCCLYMIIFTLIPVLMRGTLPHDMIENLYWGKELQWGYDKHPPLFAFLSFVFYKLSFSIPESMYLLTQLNLGVALFFIYKISKTVFENDFYKIKLSLILTLACLVFSFGNEKFNANTILISLLPTTYYFFLNMLNQQRYKDAVLFGIFAGLAFLGKYFAGIFLFLLSVFYLIYATKNKKFYVLSILTLIVFLAIISPHIYWLFQNDFITLKYAISKATTGLKNSRLFCLNFLAMLIVFYGTCPFLFKISGGKFENFKRSFDLNSRFVIFISLAPALLLFFESLILGSRIGSLWCVNMIPLIGILIVILGNCENIKYETLTKNVAYLFLICTSAMVLRFAYANHFMDLSKSTSSLNMRKISEEIYENTKQFDVNFLDCDKKTDALHIYLKSNPSLYLLDGQKQLWIRTVDGSILFTRFIKNTENVSGSFRYSNKVRVDENYSIFYGVK